MKKLLLLIAVSLIIISCEKETKEEIKQPTYKALTVTVDASVYIAQIEVNGIKINFSEKRASYSTSRIIDVGKELTISIWLKEYGTVRCDILYNNEVLKAYKINAKETKIIYKVV